MTLKPKTFPQLIFNDDRGEFVELYPPPGMEPQMDVAQVNQSFSRKGVLRGLHLSELGQQKFVSCLSGSIIDFCIDVRRDSATFGSLWRFSLSGEVAAGVFVPKGFAHGFLAMEDSNVVYCVDSRYNKAFERELHWRDSSAESPVLEALAKLGMTSPLQSEKDAEAPRINEADLTAFLRREPNL